MKKVLFIFGFATFFSCKKETETKINSTEPILEVQKIDTNNPLCGSWVGNFVASKYDESGDFSHNNKITLVISTIKDGNAIGHSVVAGNIRPFRGTVLEDNSKQIFDLKEPGDEKYDGVFQFAIENAKLVGIWTSNDKKLHVTEREFELTKKDFKYDATLMMPNYRQYYDNFDYKIKDVTFDEEDEDGKINTSIEQVQFYKVASDIITKLNASTTKLTENDLKNLKKLELEIIRNTIFARHGYTFKKKSYRQFFDPVDWYVPVSNDVSKELSNLELENIALLKRFEKYAEDHYDSFSR